MILGKFTPLPKLTNHVNSGCSQALVIKRYDCCSALTLFMSLSSLLVTADHFVEDSAKIWLFCPFIAFVAFSKNSKKLDVCVRRVTFLGK